jgi:hypothetical protein
VAAVFDSPNADSVAKTKSQAQSKPLHDRDGSETDRLTG